MALPAGLLLDGASGLVLIAFGVLAALVRPRRLATTAFALFGAAFGLRAVIDNLLPRGERGGPTDVVSLVCFVFAGLALVVFGWSHAGRLRSRRGTLLALGCGALAIAHAIIALPSRHLQMIVGEPVATGAYFFVLALLADACARASDPRERRGLALVGLSLVPWPFVNGGLNLAEAPEAGPFVVVLLFVAPALLALLWVRAATRAGWPAVVAALAIPAFWTLGGALPLFFERPGDSGVMGAARTLSVALFALAFARGGLLEGELAIRRGTLATGLLAVILIVAQIAQNFLSAEYGLLMGGLVASALLLAARPIERALERRAHAAGDDRLDVYRDAVRRSLRDGVVTREEEMHLARLARHMGLASDEALRVRHEVEDELDVKRT